MIQFGVIVASQNRMHHHMYGGIQNSRMQAIVGNANINLIRIRSKQFTIHVLRDILVDTSNLSEDLDRPVWSSGNVT